MNLFNSVKNLFLSVSDNEATFLIRGFNSTSLASKIHLEETGRKFLKGYHIALLEPDEALLYKKLNLESPVFMGFCYEGAAMAKAILDGVDLFKKDRIKTFLKSGEGNKHTYMIHVGIGWACARLPVRIEKKIQHFDPLLRWLIIDGYGFHQAYFKTVKYVIKKQLPVKLKNPYAIRVFYQGVGRCLWFTEGTAPMRIANTVSKFKTGYQADLWSGVGLACAYAGEIDEKEIYWLKELAGPFVAHFAQGVAFAAKARHRAENMVGNTENVCRIICDLTAHELATITDACLLQVDSTLLPEQQYEQWREFIRLSIFKTIKDEPVNQKVFA